jgi:hypothetical protein
MAEMKGGGDGEVEGEGMAQLKAAMTAGELATDLLMAKGGKP